jgi:heme o synthase
MTTEPATDLAAGALPRSPAGLGVLAGYWALTKPDVNLLIGITVFAGFCLARPTASSGFPIGLLVNTLLGTMLVAGGSGALNQYFERHFDAQMRRTARRPLAAGKVEPHHALCFGMLLSGTGALYLAFGVNLLASLLAFATLICYLVLYTPLKRKTSLCTLVGALAGAAPPLIGWAAASGGLSSGAWILYAMLFLWQFPHFMAIAWMYREDYDRAGYLVLPRGKGASRFMAWQSAAARGLGSAYLDPNAAWVYGADLRGGSLVSELWLSVLGSSPDSREIELCRTPAPDCFNHLPANSSPNHAA